MENTKETKFCACGCGQEVKLKRTFVNGHNARVNPPNLKKIRLIQLCQCGCGEYAKPEKNFIHGHYARVNNPMSDLKVRQRHFKAMQVDELKKRISRALLGHIKSEETCQKLSKALKNRKTPWLYGDKNPMTRSEVKAKHSRAVNNFPDMDVIIEKRKQTSMEKYGVDNYSLTDEFKESILGKNHPNWKGGISCEPYCEIWLDKEYKESIKKRDNYTCQNPECKHENTDLLIHHINYIKKDCIPENLITLCRSCNGKANFNRNEWQRLFKDIIKTKEKAA
jgi:hypothetical protein